MKFCHDCGIELPADVKFCPSCGTPVLNTHSSKPTSNNDFSNGKEDSSRKTIMRNGMVYGVVDLNNLPEGHIIEERYEIKRKIGQGGFGAVYLAFDRKMNIEKALKVIPESISNDKRAIETLRQEAQTMIKLNHPNIVRFYDFHDKGTIKFIDMEYIDGESMNEHLLDYEEHKMPEEEVKGYAKQMLKGLGYAHDENVIHRDIKPQNIMLNKSEQIKLMDFGIAETLRNSVSRLENSTSSGTLVYMSPEQIRGKDVGRESDIYSLGATLYELLSGNPPFHKGDINYQILNEVPDQIEDISNITNKVLQKSLSKDISDRFRNSKEMKDALEGIYKERIVAKGKRKDPKHKERIIKNVEKKGFIKRQNWLKIGIAIIGVIIISLIATWFFSGAELNSINEVKGILSLSDHGRGWGNLSDLEQSRIEAMIRKGDEQYINNKLFSPVGDNAYETFQEALKLHPGNKDAKDRLIVMSKDFAKQIKNRITSQKYSEAEKFLTKALNYFPNNKELIRLKIRNEITPLEDKAKEYADNKAFISPEGNNAYKLSIKIQEKEPENKVAMEILKEINDWFKIEGEKYTKDSNWKDALDLYTQAFTYFPEDEYFSKRKTEIKKKYYENLKDSFLKNGDAYYKNKDWGKAVKNYKEALNYFPDNSLFKKKLNECQKFYKGVVRENKINNILRKARSYANIYDWNRAFNKYNEVLKIDPNNKSAKNGKAGIPDLMVKHADELVSKRKYYEAKQLYQRALKYKPNDILIKIKLERANERKL